VPAPARRAAGSVPLVGVAGRVYEPVTFLVEAGHVAAFARALGVDPGQGVPPTYAAVYALGTTVPQLFSDPEAAVDVAHLLHAEQEFSWERHPRLGETLVAQGRVAGDVERRGVRLLTFETEVRAGDERLCTSRALFVVRAPGR